MTPLEKRWQSAFDGLPLIAILRGLETTDAIAVGTTLAESGFRIIEVPLNSPNAFESVRLLGKALGSDVVVGTGTVLSAEDVEMSMQAGGSLIVAPNLDLEVASAARQHDAIYCPGVATPSEAFSALGAGAHALKFFPAEAIPPNVVKAMRAVLPPTCCVLPVGGITPTNMQPYLDAGANGFGIGSALFKPGKSLTELREDATQFVQAFPPKH